MKALDQFVYISHEYGKRVCDVQGGGGNTSVKDGDIMYIKASGCLLKDVTKSRGYGAVLHQKIHDFYEEGNDITENEAYAFINSEKAFAQNTNAPSKKPSMETGFHAILDKYVLHTHNVFVNIVLCSENSTELLHEILSTEDFLFTTLPYNSPGLAITLDIKNAQNMKKTEVIFLEQHGLIVHGDNLERVESVYQTITKKIINFFSLPDFLMSDELVKDEGGFSTGAFSDEDWEIARKVKENVIYPDQEIFFKDADITFLDNKLTFNKISKEKAISIYENLLAYIYVCRNHVKLGLVTKYLNNEDREYLHMMKSEKFRKGVQ